MIKPHLERLLVFTCITVNVFLILVIGLLLTTTVIPMITTAGIEYHGYSTAETGVAEMSTSADHSTTLESSGMLDLQPQLSDGETIECVIRNQDGQVVGSSSSSSGGSSR